MSYVAVAIGGAAVIGFVGNKMSSDAQQEMSEQQLFQQQQDRVMAGYFAQPTSTEIQSMQKQMELYNRVYQLNMAAVDRQQRLVEAVDPSLIEAGKQAYQLMQGGDSAMSAPIMAARARQRDQLRQQLASQLGPGAETSSAGIQALTKFDQGTDQLRTQTASQLLGVAAQAKPDMVGEIGRAQSGLASLNSNIFNQSDAIQKRKIAAQEGTPLAGYQGADQVGNIGMGNGLASLGNEALKAGLSAWGRKAGQAAVTPPPEI